jgi:hypothetical protein
MSNDAEYWLCSSMIIEMTISVCTCFIFAVYSLVQPKKSLKNSYLMFEVPNVHALDACASEEDRKKQRHRIYHVCRYTFL